MKTYFLSAPAQPTSAHIHLIGVIQEMSLLHEERHVGKVYSTSVHVASEHEPFEFVTTSKDLHLELGRMSKAGRWHMAHVLEDLFSKDGSNHLMFQMREDGGVVLVTRSCEANGKMITFTLSPAR